MCRPSGTIINKIESGDRLIIKGNEKKEKREKPYRNRIVVSSGTLIKSL